MTCKNKTILIAGADRFIVSNLTEALVKKGAQLYYIILSTIGMAGRYQLIKDKTIIIVD
jgi:hypothetical protein